MSRQFKDHLTSYGIQHRISCPHTSEQNGMAEHKHMHITELGLPMMFDSHLPLNFWVEAFFAASYIGNHLLSVQNNKSNQVELLLQQKPEYSHMRVLGSACYPYLRPVADHKMEPRSLQCVFLEYSPQYKGYKCLYPPTCKVYISRYVVVDEEVFPFKDAYKQFVPRYESTLLKAWQSVTAPLEAPQPSQVMRILQPPIQTEETPLQPEIHQQISPPPSPIPSPQEEVHEVSVVNTHPMRTSGKSGIQRPNTRYALLTSTRQHRLPRNIREAMEHP